MDTVKAAGQEFEIVEAPGNDVEEYCEAKDELQQFPRLAVTGVGRSLTDSQKYELVWYIDEDAMKAQPEDMEDWCDWDNPDQADLLIEQERAMAIRYQLVLY